jgi:hypothetical protein
MTAAPHLKVLRRPGGQCITDARASLRQRFAECGEFARLLQREGYGAYS